VELTRLSSRTARNCRSAACSRESCESGSSSSSEFAATREVGPTSFRAHLCASETVIAVWRNWLTRGPERRALGMTLDHKCSIQPAGAPGNYPLPFWRHSCRPSHLRSRHRLPQDTNSPLNAAEHRRLISNRRPCCDPLRHSARSRDSRVVAMRGPAFPPTPIDATRLGHAHV
jgi:hypothetical protein